MFRAARLLARIVFGLPGRLCSQWSGFFVCALGTLSLLFLSWILCPLLSPHLPSIWGGSGVARRLYLLKDTKAVYHIRVLFFAACFPQHALYFGGDESVVLFAQRRASVSGDDAYTLSFFCVQRVQNIHYVFERQVRAQACECLPAKRDCSLLCAKHLFTPSHFRVFFTQVVFAFPMLSLKQLYLDVCFALFAPPPAIWCVLRTPQAQSHLPVLR